MFIHRLLTFAALGAMTATSTAATFEIEENFDDDSHFTQSENLPDGWATNYAYFKRTNSVNSGRPSYSGDNMLGCSNHTGYGNNNVVYTPLMEVAGGKPFGIEFMLLAPGGTPPDVRNCGLNIYAGTTQDIAQMTLVHTRPYKENTDYEKVTASYTPETDGMYCFAVEVTTALPGGAGGTWFDDFFFTGTEPAKPLQPDQLDPDPDNLALCEELPFSENFSDATHYDGTSVLPKGWLSTGTNVWRTASDNDLPAYSGEWYMVAPDSENSRDERAYTPFFNLKEGVEYTLSFQSHFDGYVVGDTERSTTLHVTVGTQHDSEFHATPLLSVSRVIDEKGKWVAEEVKFTPAKAGAYCFAFNLEGDAYSGMTCIDDVRLTSPIDIPRPEPDMQLKALFSYTDNTIQAFPGQPVRLVNTSRYATGYAWKAEGVTLNQFEDGSADVIFPASGEYKVSLTASNERGERTTTKTLKVTLNEASTETVPFLAYDPSGVKVYQRGEVPSYDTDPNGLDYISGVNHYYRTIAERYDLPGDGTFKLRKFAFYIANLRYVPRTSQADDQRLLPMTVTVYGSDDDGNLDESKVLWSHTDKMGEIFDDRGFGSSVAQLCTITTDDTEVSGTIYFAFEFDPAFEIEVADKNVGRSFVSLCPVRQRNGITTTYARPTAVSPEVTIQPDGKWHPLHEIHPDCNGIGLFAQLWADYLPKGAGAGSLTEGADVSLWFDGHDLHATGLSHGDVVAVYDIAGRLVLTASADGDTATVDCNALQHGTYIVTSPAGCGKFVK